MSPFVIPLPPTGLPPDAVSALATVPQRVETSTGAVLVSIAMTIALFLAGKWLMQRAYGLVSTRLGVTDDAANRFLVIAMGVMIGVSPIAVVVFH
jgi:hypothetical protein